jgi:hypothetical protein
MVQTTTRKTARSNNDRLVTSFPEWAVGEVDRLLTARERARSVEEKTQYDLKLALICDAARRYGDNLEDTAEL